MEILTKENLVGAWKLLPLFRKILVSVKFSARNSGAGNGCANFMGAWKNAFFLQEKAMSIKFLVLGGGGVFGFLGGGGGADYIFLGARIFLNCSFQGLHSLSKENQVSLVRTFLSEPGSGSQISRLGGWGWKNDLWELHIIHFAPFTGFIHFFSGWHRNRTGTGNRNRRNRFCRNRTRHRNRLNRFPGTETGTGTVLSVKLC